MQAQVRTQTTKIKLGMETPREFFLSLPDELKNVCIEMYTWGSCRKGYLEIIYPKRIKLVYYTSRKGEYITEIPGLAKIKVWNHDSNKNIHREVEFIDVYQPLIIYYYGATSCSSSFDQVFVVEKAGNDVVFRRLEVQEEFEEREAGKYRDTIKREFVVYNNQKLVLSETVIRSELIMEKLVIRVKADGDAVYVNGDTYFIKEQLKKLGFKWNPDAKVWFSTSTEVESVVEEIKRLGVQVVVE
jgi:hypothetical protein